MKLISCYIENFGGLHQYALTFQEGLTVLKEANGFGKTTLAEFLRAMFYGFPRAAKKLEKNPRKKYLPWQGGKYGGHLVFEHEGRRYRIERTFGEVPKNDTFLLTDAATHKKSLDFSENIGLELFGLDSDSFERSTYMPQLQESGSLTTTGIQAKLGGLVEDTNDINNYDKALEALKKKRSSFVPYKGNSGSVAEANQRISDLQVEIETAEAQRSLLTEVLAQLEEARTVLAAKSGARDSIRGEMTLAAQYSAREALAKQQTAMERALEDCLQDAQTLEVRYPAGLPSLKELENAEPVALRLSALEQRDLPIPADAEQILREQAPRFSQGSPETAELEQTRTRIRSYMEMESKRKSLIPSPGEAEQLEGLARFFAPGVPEDEALSQWAAQARQLTALEERRSAAAPDPAELAKLRELEGFFGGDVPTEEALTDCQQKLNRASDVRQENVRISAQAVPEAPAPAVQKKKSVVLFALFGLLSVLAGVLLLAVQAVGGGAALMGVGVLLLALFFLLKQREDRQELERKIQDSRAGGPILSQAQRETLLRNERTAAVLEQEVLSFTAAYPCTRHSLSDKLAQIRGSRESLLELRQKQAALEVLRESLLQELTALARQLQGHLAPYFGSGEGYEENILTLREKRAAYRRLLESSQRRKAETESLARTLESLEDCIRKFLEPYCGLVPPGEFDTCLSRLERDAAAYADAKKRLENYRSQCREREAEMAQCRAALSALSQKYTLPEALTGWSGLQRLREDVKNAARLGELEQSTRSALERFRREHRDVLLLPERKDLRELEDLKATERYLSEGIREAEEQRVSLEQKQRLLLEKIDRIPDLEDELEQWKQKKNADLDSSRLLDETIRFLGEAKESLSDSYLGTIQQKFAEYMGRVAGEDREKLFVSSQLEVSLERLGEARPLACFSAGQTDTVMLCMRMALVDALFREAAPFVILDDPFVNLDDAHLSQALSLLQDLSQTRQILYLTCNTGRTWGEWEIEN